MTPAKKRPKLGKASQIGLAIPSLLTNGFRQETNLGLRKMEAERVIFFWWRLFAMCSAGRGALHLTVNQLTEPHRDRQDATKERSTDDFQKETFKSVSSNCSPALFGSVGRILKGKSKFYSVCLKRYIIELKIYY